MPVMELRKETINGVSSGNGSSSSSSDKSNCPKKTSNMEAELLQCICRPLVASGACRACLFRANKSRCWSLLFHLIPSYSDIPCNEMDSIDDGSPNCHQRQAQAKSTRPLSWNSNKNDQLPLMDIHGLLWKEKGINGTSARQYAGEFSEQNYQLMHHHRGSFQ
ncbi:hypothetical protein Tsp_10524 [Trichinella spiralis]|uniref:hypothetical protein n=1 Tax=Trichinella spiralis TaxID=6334 RepID=UPI0001EFD56E|nr:hypothetical protein Tsp_10524 [Trichinella spiralis]